MSFYKLLKHTIGWKFLNTALVFFINLLMVRLLGITDSGNFFYDIALFSFLILILSWSLEAGIVYYASQYKGALTSIILFVLPLLLFQTILCWIVLKYISFSVSHLVAMLFIIGNLTINYFSAFFYAKKWFVSLNIITCIINFCTVIVLFYCWLSKSLNGPDHTVVIVTYIAGISCQALVLVLVILLSMQKNTSFITREKEPVIKQILLYSSIAIISNVVTFLVTRIDYYFVEKYCSSVALSNYIQVSKFGQLLILVPSIIASVVFPYSAGSGQSLGMGKVQQLCRGIMLAFIPVGLIIMLTANWLLPWLFGKGFNLMYPALLFYLPGFFALSITAVLAAHLAGKKLLIANLTASLLALIIVITGDILLIPISGINGAAAVSSIAYIACCTHLLWFCKRRFNTNAADFFYIKKSDISSMAQSIKKIIYY